MLIQKYCLFFLSKKIQRVQRSIKEKVKSHFKGLDSIFLDVIYTQTHIFLKNGDMKIAVFHLMDLPYLSMCITFRPRPPEQCFPDPVLDVVCVFLHGQGGRILCNRPPEHFPISQSTCESLCFAEMHVNEALCGQQLVLQEPGGVLTERACFYFLVQGEFH